MFRLLLYDFWPNLWDPFRNCSSSLSAGCFLARSSCFYILQGGSGLANWTSRLRVVLEWNADSLHCLIRATCRWDLPSYTGGCSYFPSYDVSSKIYGNCQQSLLEDHSSWWSRLLESSRWTEKVNKTVDTTKYHMSRQLHPYEETSRSVNSVQNIWGQ